MNFVCNSSKSKKTFFFAMAELFKSMKQMFRKAANYEL
jgi:hypothetical protein